MPSSFMTPLVVEYVDRKWDKIYLSFKYRVGSLTDPVDTIEVPVGFHTDYATIPFFMRSYFSPRDRWAKAAVVHDFLYSKGSGRDYSRKDCDDIFFEGMEVLNVPSWKKWGAYFAVRLFGWYFWKKK